MGIKTGAGIIPFAIQHQQLQFLFHRTFSGRRAGLLVDFGGGSLAGETQHQTAAREFVEETEAMFLAADPKQASLALHADAQIQITLNLIQDTQVKHPEWWCQRSSQKNKRPKDWKSFFVRMPYQDLRRMNRLWKQAPQGRFKKRRALVWISSERLLELFSHQPEKLWTRVRELHGATAVIRRIEQHYQASPKDDTE